MNFDTGDPTHPFEYRMADDAYARLAIMLAKRDPAALSPAVRDNVLAFFGDCEGPFSTRRQPKQWAANRGRGGTIGRRRRTPRACKMRVSPLPRCSPIPKTDLYCEQVPLADLAASVGTPAYVYSSRVLLDNFHAYETAFGDVPHAVCYAVKANSCLAVLALLAKAGAGFDIVSGGELYRVLEAGGDPSRVVFSGVGKTAAEIEYALASGIHSFNCESEAELTLIDALAARRGVRAAFALRVNPDVDASTHPYISTSLSEHKFGIPIGEAPQVYDRARRFRNLAANGVSCHIGSQVARSGADSGGIGEGAGSGGGVARARAWDRACRFGAAAWGSRTGMPRRRRPSRRSSGS